MNESFPTLPNPPSEPSGRRYVIVHESQYQPPSTASCCSQSKEARTDSARSLQGCSACAELFELRDYQPAPQRASKGPLLPSSRKARPCARTCAFWQLLHPVRCPAGGRRSDGSVTTLVGRLASRATKRPSRTTQFGDRRQGTDRNRAAIDWIEAQLKSYGAPHRTAPLPTHRRRRRPSTGPQGAPSTQPAIQHRSGASTRNGIVRGEH